MSAPCARNGLAFAVAPCLVLATALVLFEVVGFGFEHLTDRAYGGFADPGLEVDLRARVLWATTVLLHLGTCGAAIVVSARLLLGGPGRRALPVYLGVAALLVVLQATVATVDGLAPNFQALFDTTWKALSASGGYDGGELARIRRVIEGVNLASAVAPALVLVAGCTALRFETDEPVPPARIAERLRLARTMLNVGSALLVTGILHMAVWTRWPAALAVDVATAAGLEQVTAGVTLFWGAAYSLLAAVWYLPTSQALTACARRALADQPELAGEDGPEAWLAENGFEAATLRRLPQLAALLAPLLAGPVGASLGDLGGALG